MIGSYRRITELEYEKKGIGEFFTDLLFMFYWILFCTIIPYSIGTVLSTNVAYIAVHQSFDVGTAFVQNIFVDLVKM